MISLKQHAISIAAIFLALAIGIVLGSQTLASSLLSGLRDDKSALRRQHESLQSENNDLRSQVTSADGFGAAMTGRILHDVLAGRSVVLVGAPGADPADTDAIGRLIAAAGGTVSGRLALTTAFADSGNAERLRSTVTNIIPAGVQLRTDAVDPGSLAGDLLGAVLQLNPGSGAPQSNPQERTLALDTLRSGGFITFGGEVNPGNLAVVVTGGDAESADGSRGSVIARFAGGLDARGAGTVLAGRAAAALGNGPVSVARSDSGLAAAISTVDNIDRQAGRITTVLALQEQQRGAAGRYGTGPKAASVTVN